ncbi:glycosyltransferase family 39 protein [bacterium SCSIO 12741]|nr:glycosyltransferase family 39 protein [bacterium SCSIO 12741]
MKTLLQLSSGRAMLVIAVFAALLFIPALGNVALFDWDEVNFAEAAREMLVTGNYSMVQIDYQPFWEKPPIFFWMQALSMKLFGVSEYAARFPNAVCGIFTLMLLYHLGRRFYDARMGWIWSGVYAASLLPQLYFKSGIIDPWFNLFIFAGIYFAYAWFHDFKEGHSKWKWAVLSGVSIGLGVMTKGPVAFLIFGMVWGIFWAFYRFRKAATFPALLTFTAAFVFSGSFWFLFEYSQGRGYIVTQFIDYQIRLLQTGDAGHSQPFFYHWYVLLIGCFPLSVAALFSLFHRNKGNQERKLWARLMGILFWSVLLLFSLVKTKIIHYSSLCYFPLSYFAAYTIYRQVTAGERIKWPQLTLTMIIGFALVILFGGLAWVGMNTETFLSWGLMNDPFAEANLQAEAYWTWMDYAPALVLLPGLIIYAFAKTQAIRNIGLYGFSLLCFHLFMVLHIPKIERYTQGAAIDFYRTHAREGHYVETYRFKSYADLFYTRKMPVHEGREPDYMVMKFFEREAFEAEKPHYQWMYDLNGFSFYAHPDKVNFE